MNLFEVFQKDGEVRLIRLKDIQDLACELIAEMIPFCIVYDEEFVVVRSIDWAFDSGEK